MIETLNEIADDESIPVNYISCNARAMKFLLLLIVLGLVDFKTDCKNKLKALDAINEKLSAFSSAKADSVMKAFSGYSNTVIEEYRLLALISKGGHSFKRVKIEWKYWHIILIILTIENNHLELYLLRKQMNNSNK